MAELEQRLAEPAERLELPATPPLAARVGDELRAVEPPARPRRGTPRLRGVTSRPRRTAPRLRLAFLVVFAVLLLAAGAVAAVPATRHAVLELLGLRGETIERVPRLPENARAKPAWRLGRPTTLVAARPRLSFEPLLPDGLEGPNGIFLNYGTPGRSLNLTYPPQQGLPRSRFTGVGLLVNELNGHVAPGFYGKMVPRDARVERFGIDGRFAVWVEKPAPLLLQAGHRQHLPHRAFAPRRQRPPGPARQGHGPARGRVRQSDRDRDRPHPRPLDD